MAKKLADHRVTVAFIHHAAELNDQAVTRRLDEPAGVRGDRRTNQPNPDGLQPCEGAALIRPDQS